MKIDAKGDYLIRFGRTDISLQSVEQIVDPSQTRAIGNLIHAYSKRYAARGIPLREGLEKLLEEIERDGFDALSPFKPGNLAMPRVMEAAAAVNRMRTLKIRRD